MLVDFVWLLCCCLCRFCSAFLIAGWHMLLVLGRPKDSGAQDDSHAFALYACSCRALLLSPFGLGQTDSGWQISRPCSSASRRASRTQLSSRKWTSRQALSLSIICVACPIACGVTLQFALGAVVLVLESGGSCGSSSRLLSTSLLPCCGSRHTQDFRRLLEFIYTDTGAFSLCLFVLRARFCCLFYVPCWVVRLVLASAL